MTIEWKSCSRSLAAAWRAASTREESRRDLRVDPVVCPKSPVTTAAVLAPLWRDQRHVVRGVATRDFEIRASACCTNLDDRSRVRCRAAGARRYLHKEDEGRRAAPRGCRHSSVGGNARSARSAVRHSRAAGTRDRPEMERVTVAASKRKTLNVTAIPTPGRAVTAKSTPSFTSLRCFVERLNQGINASRGVAFSRAGARQRRTDRRLAAEVDVSPRPAIVFGTRCASRVLSESARRGAERPRDSGRVRVTSDRRAPLLLAAS